MTHNHDRQTNAPGPGMTLGDIYYVLFRHKWKIIICSVVGLLVAGVFFVVQRPPYQSEAKLFIRYVVEARSPSPTGDSSKTISPDDRGMNIINSEIEILTSLDVAQQVADVIGPEKILAKVGGGKDRLRAAAYVRRNLTVDVPLKSSVLLVTFQHPDPDVVQPVLRQVIDSYFKKHAEIHREPGVFDDYLTQETDQLRSRLDQTEEELRKAKNKAGVISLDDSKKAYTEEISKIREELFTAEADLAEREAALKEITKQEPGKPATASSAPVTPSAQVDQYKALVTRLDLLWKKQQDLLTQFTDENQQVKEVGEQIIVAEQLKKKFETEHPSLLSLAIGSTKSDGQPAATSTDLSAQLAQIPALESRIKVLNSQLDQIRAEATSVDEMEGSIQELQRKKDLEEANYKYFSASLEQSRIDEALGAGKTPNISRIQEPSPPFRAPSKSAKIAVMLAASGILGGLAWAFLIELYLDRSVKRPSEIETRLGLPLFLSIPDFSRNGHRRQIAGNGSPVPVLADTEPWDPEHPLRRFYEALRDRLVVYFEVNELTHKPKLLALTGAGKGSGVSTVAAGLAACLSETGDGNVLLVDMNREQGAAQQFYKGASVCKLDEALYRKDDALVQNNLYVVDGRSNGDRLSRILPKQFTHLVPKLKASDYDYIIFDMPAISQTSVTPRLAGFMDMVLLVVESEKTDRETVQQACNLLAGSRAKVCAVLNKTHSYVPPRLNQGNLSEA